MKKSVESTQNSSTKETIMEFWARNGATLEQKTGAILMPVSKAQREAMQKSAKNKDAEGE
jgi:hypothetical protein